MTGDEVRALLERPQTIETLRQALSGVLRWADTLDELVDGDPVGGAAKRLAAEGIRDQVAVALGAEL